MKKKKFHFLALKALEASDKRISWLEREVREINTNIQTLNHTQRLDSRPECAVKQ